MHGTREHLGTGLAVVGDPQHRVHVPGPGPNRVGRAEPDPESCDSSACSVGHDWPTRRCRGPKVRGGGVRRGEGHRGVRLRGQEAPLAGGGIMPVGPSPRGRRAQRIRPASVARTRTPMAQTAGRPTGLPSRVATPAPGPGQRDFGLRRYQSGGKWGRIGRWPPSGSSVLPHRPGGPLPGPSVGPAGEGRGWLHRRSLGSAITVSGWRPPGAGRRGGRRLGRGRSASRPPVRARGSVGGAAGRPPGRGPARGGRRRCGTPGPATAAPGPHEAPAGRRPAEG